MQVCGEREAMVMAPTLMHDSAVSSCFLGCLAFLHRLSHHNLLPHIPSISLSTVNSSPCPRIAPQSLNSSSQPLRLPGDPCPCLGYGWLPQGLPDSQFNLGCCRSAVSLSVLNISPLTQTIALMWGWDPCFSSPTHGGLVPSY